MRTKTLRALVTFSSAVQAMALEEAAARAGLPGRLIPVPREISAGCGLAYQAPPEAEEALLALIRAEGLSVEGVRRMEL